MKKTITQRDIATFLRKSLISHKGLYFAIVASLLLFSSCDRLKNPSSNNDNTEETVQNSVDDTETKIPKYAGNWASQNGGWQIQITKVNDKLYDLKYYNPTNGETEKKISGAYSLSGDYTYIFKPVPYDANDIEETKNARDKVYRINFSEDGRLYWGGEFYSRTK